MINFYDYVYIFILICLIAINSFIYLKEIKDDNSTIDYIKPDLKTQYLITLGLLSICLILVILNSFFTNKIITSLVILVNLLTVISLVMINFYTFKIFSKEILTPLNVLSISLTFFIIPSFLILKNPFNSNNL